MPTPIRPKANTAPLAEASAEAGARSINMATTGATTRASAAVNHTEKGAV